MFLLWLQVFIRKHAKVIGMIVFMNLVFSSGLMIGRVYRGEFVMFDLWFWDFIWSLVNWVIWQQAMEGKEEE
jgi:hypothetical protein